MTIKLSKKEFEEEEIDYDSILDEEEDEKIVIELHLNKEKKQKTKFVESTKEEKKDVEFHTVEFGLVLKKEYKLFLHQVETIEWMKGVEEKTNDDDVSQYGMKGGLIALKMGLGKTLVSVSMCMMKNQSSDLPNLVVVPNSVSYTWKHDIEKFFGDTCPYLFYHKSNPQLKNNFDEITFKKFCKYKIILVTYDTIMMAAKKSGLYEKQKIFNGRNAVSGILNARERTISDAKEAEGSDLLFLIPWNRIIADESHHFANPTSLTYQTMMSLYGKKKWCLSGSPLRNYDSDIFTQLRFCGYNGVISAKEFNIELYRRHKLYEFSLYKNYEDAGISLPDIHEKTIILDLEDEEKEIYNFYFSKTKETLARFNIGAITYSSVLTLFLRMRQICIAPYTILDESMRKTKTKTKNEDDSDDEDETLSRRVQNSLPQDLGEWVKNKYGTAGIKSKKISEIIHILKNVEKGEKTLVFTMFKKVIDIACLAMKEFLPSRKFLVLDGDVKGKDRDLVLDKFKENSKYDVMFISYKVGSEGLNLVEANNIIMCEHWWTPIVKDQAKARSHRIGQKNEVNVWNLVIRDSIEDRMEEICRKKTELMSEFLNEKNTKQKEKKEKLGMSRNGGIDKNIIRMLIGRTK